MSPSPNDIPRQPGQQLELRGFETGRFNRKPEPVMEECRRLVPGFAHWSAVQAADFEPPFSTAFRVITWERMD